MNPEFEHFESTCYNFSRPNHRYIKRLTSRILNGQIFLSIFPPLRWFPKYRWREDFGSDLMSGIITGIMLVPQGIAYAFLAGVDPINGLYSSFFSPFFYFLFGLSPHISRGPSSVLGVMSQISNHAIQEELNYNGMAVGEKGLDASSIASTLTFACGIIQIMMGLFRFKFLADYFSDALISGFVCGAALHTIISQLDKFLGVKLKPHSGYFGAFFNLHDLFLKSDDYKWQTITLSGCSLIFLTIGKFFIAPWIRRKCSFVMPCELLLIIITATLSNFLNWREEMPVVGTIPKGFPTPQLPSFEILPYCLTHALAICSVTVALHFSMTKLFANKFHYSIRLSNELYAIGFGSTFAGFFPTYPTSTALARTMVLVESGARTQLASGFSALLVLVVILVVGPLFEPLPQCVLSAIIVISLKTVFSNFKSASHLWNIDKFDFIIWCFAFFGTLFTNVIVGLGIGVLTSLLTMIIRIQWPSWSYKLVQNTPSNGPRICIFHFQSSLIFANCARFSTSTQKSLNDWLILRNQHLSILQQSEKVEKHETLFVFDCSSINQIDSMGLKTLTQSVEMVLKSDVSVELRNVNENLLKLLKTNAKLSSLIVINHHEHEN